MPINRNLSWISEETGFDLVAATSLNVTKKEGVS